MVIVDANVLLYAVDRASLRHEESRNWLDRSLGGVEAVGLAWLALLAFVRVGTNAAIFPSPMSVEEALAQVEAWTHAPSGLVVEPTARHVGILGGLLLESGTAGNLTNDAHLAALALEHGAEIVSYDRDFARFEGVKHRLPG
ncbi:MAG: type II toxin-antitoxin system VapC family toxin [Actinomycetota bacterium]|nr:type II toxin-antitoxin system VapC family toxin [Actinomycetota bacterium]